MRSCDLQDDMIAFSKGCKVATWHLPFQMTSFFNKNKTRKALNSCLFVDWTHLSCHDA